MTTRTTIENPVINSPFEEPKRHFQFTDEGITNTIVKGRRKSVYFVPIPKPKTRGKNLELDFPVECQPEENRLINDIRQRVGLWRASNYPHVTQITRRLLGHWSDPQRERRLFFCQREALETIIYLTEVAPSRDANVGTDLLNRLQHENRQATPAGHPVLKRYAAKMATGSGKTVVMAMLIAWQTLNKQANTKDKRFSDAFLIVAPGITIKDRLRALLPSDPDNYYKKLDLVPPTFLDQLGSAKIVITNYHSFMLRERGEAAALTKKILTGRQETSPFRETEEQMVRRVCGELGTKKEIIVLNDEAHHCYHGKPIPDEVREKLTGEDKKAAEEREEEARVWISGLEAIERKTGVKAVYDLSATPFFLAGSGYSEGTLFPWVVSDFSLIDAIESGIVKVPRVPVEDNTDKPDQPVFRNLWSLIGKKLPKGSRSKKNEGQVPDLPKELESALLHLYGHYEKSYELYEQQIAAGFDVMPPVFIVVCSNTQVSKLVFDWIAGYEKTLSDSQTVIVPGNLPIFSNVEQGSPANAWSHRPNSLLIDSQQLESGEALTDEFKAIAAREIEEFKTEIRERFPGRDVDKLTHEDILREVMNTVGKKGKLGEHIKCVVSVSMLTEGWDANTVTHIMGVRAFGTQLLCEQVIGRGLRRMSYEAEPQTVTVDGEEFTFDAFPVEYAEVYGVPFDFIPTAGGRETPKPPRDTVYVHTVEERGTARIAFPRVQGYRYEIAAEKLAAKFTESSRLILNTKHIPTLVENAPIVGESSIHRLDELRERRINEVAFLLAKLVLEKYFRQEVTTEHVIGGPIENEVKSWLFPQVLGIAKQWLHEYVDCQDNTFPQMLLLIELAHTAAERVYLAIVSGTDGQAREPMLKPILQPHNTVGDTGGIGYHTSKPTYQTSGKSHISHVVMDSGWEGTVAQALEHMGEVKAYVKNITRLDFLIPYTIGGQERSYLPDFIARIDDGQGEGDLLNLIIEVSGERRDDKDAKVATVENLWVPAVNNDGRFGRWGFIQIKDPYQVMKEIRKTFAPHLLQAA
jgi:type III restriction enzyme